MIRFIYLFFLAFIYFIVCDLIHLHDPNGKNAKIKQMRRTRTQIRIQTYIEKERDYARSSSASGRRVAIAYALMTPDVHTIR